MGTCRICGKNFGLIGGYMEEFTGERLNVCVDCIKKFRQISEEDSSRVRTIVDDLISSCNNEKTLPILKKYKAIVQDQSCKKHMYLNRLPTKYYRVHNIIIIEEERMETMQITNKDIQSEQIRQEIREQLTEELKTVLPAKQIQKVVFAYNKVSVRYESVERRE